jgi:hypothetical protein
VNGLLDRRCSVRHGALLTHVNVPTMLCCSLAHASCTLAQIDRRSARASAALSIHAPPFGHLRPSTRPPRRSAQAIGRPAWRSPCTGAVRRAVNGPPRHRERFTFVRAPFGSSSDLHFEGPHLRCGWYCGRPGSAHRHDRPVRRGPAHPYARTTPARPMHDLQICSRANSRQIQNRAVAPEIAPGGRRCLAQQNRFRWLRTFQTHPAETLRMEVIGQVSQAAGKLTTGHEPASGWVTFNRACIDVNGVKTKSLQTCVLERIRCVADICFSRRPAVKIPG